MDVKILNGDCFDVLKTFEAESVDSVVTDPPFGIFFMQARWDCEVPKVEVWKEVFRVMKPGAHLLSFFGTRTYHRGVVAIEDAGFEIRDMISWLNGQGYPKSYDISKGMDRQNGTYIEGEVSPNSRESGPSPSGCYGESVQRKHLANPQSDEAKKWAGWGTGLKPSMSPIVVARKPLIGTVVENVLKYGCGALNIDGCRIPPVDEQDIENQRNGMIRYQKSRELGGSGGVSLCGSVDGSLYKNDRTLVFKPEKGRWPSNLAIDNSEEVKSLFPIVSSGLLKAGTLRNKNAKVGYNGGWGERVATKDFGNDRGSAARFFYCAKADHGDREEGLIGKIPCDTCGNLNSREHLVDGRKGRCIRNPHNTVKPVDLMRWLVRLVTPPNGIVLDPFMGSGTTGKAAVLESFNFIGIERESKWCEVARTRINKVLEQPGLF